MTLEPDAPVLEAARAIEQNNIGASVLGILTDRDLAIRVVGRGLDPRTTTIGEVMTTNVASLASTDSQASAIRLMLRRNVRRIPLVDDGRFVGLVTLDDLLLDEAAPVERLAAVIEAQIGEGGPAASARSPARRRSAARAEATYRRLVRQLRADAGLDEDEQAETALGLVLEALVRRLSPDEADDLIAQLPSLLQPSLYALATGPDRLVTRESIEQDLARQLDLGPARAARLLAAVGALIDQAVSPGQMDDVRGQLPASLREIFSR
ncbi:MAG: DUF2267 domain-containing protein [Burkholderiaceae bacterium]|nr:DUF2267 domain-containing protein [Burkholderiaceae bacterium]